MLVVGAPVGDDGSARRAGSSHQASGPALATSAPLGDVPPAQAVEASPVVTPATSITASIAVGPAGRRPGREAAEGDRSTLQLRVVEAQGCGRGPVHGAEVSADVGTDEAAVDDSTPTPTFLDNDLKEGDYRRVKNLYRAQGRAACYVYDEWWRRCEVDFVVPGKERLFTFDAWGRGAPFLLVLDPYGDEVMSKKYSVGGPRRRRCGGDGRRPPRHRGGRAGGAHRATHGWRGRRVRLGVYDWRVLQELPLREDFPPGRPPRAPGGAPQQEEAVLHDGPRPRPLRFIERWASYSDVLANLVVSFAFDGEDVQVSGDSWRSVTRWETTASRAPR